MAQSSAQLRQQLERYIPTTQGEIFQDLMNRVGSFRPQIEELASLETQAMQAAPSMLDQYNQEMGNVGGLSAMNRLASMQGQIGDIYGTRDVLQGLLQANQSNLRGLAGQIFDQYQAGRSNLKDLYSMAVQEEERRRAAAASRRAAAMQAAAMRSQQQRDMLGAGELEIETEDKKSSAGRIGTLWQKLTKSQGGKLFRNLVINPRQTLLGINRDIRSSRGGGSWGTSSRSSALRSSLKNIFENSTKYMKR